MKIIILTTILTVFFSSSVLAKHRYAKVISVEPVYKYLTISTPRELCHTPSHQNRQHPSANTVLGAIIGGTIGNAIGHKSKNAKMTTAAGAVIGGIIGHELGHQRHNRYSSSQTCVTSHAQYKKIRKLTGYNVFYRFKGRTYQTFSHENPGKKIIVGDKTRPVVHASHHRSSHLASQYAFQH